LARASSKRPWLVIGGWLVALVVAVGLISALLADTLTTDFDFTDNPEAKRAELLLESRMEPPFGGPETFAEAVVISSASAVATDPAFAQYVGDIEAAALSLGPDKVLLASALGPDDQPQISPDGHNQIVSVVLANSDIDEASTDAEELREKVDAVAAPADIEARIFGQATANNDFVILAEEGLVKGESIGVSVAIIVLLAVIGTAMAASLPILLAFAAIFLALGLVSLVGQLFDLTFFVQNFITMIGLAVGIDYALFIVARYREERQHGFEHMESIGRAGATANRAVLFSGLTVVLALLGMLFVPNTIFRSLSVGAILVVLVAVAASMTLLPAAMALLGDRLAWGRGWPLVKKGAYALAFGVPVLILGLVLSGTFGDALTIIGGMATGIGGLLVVAGFVTLRTSDLAAEGGMWDKITHSVMGRPVMWLVGGTALMLFFGSFWLSMDTGFSGPSTLPERLESRQAFDILQNDFGFIPTDPIEIVIDGQVTAEVEAAVADLSAAVALNPVLGAPDPLVVNEAGDLALLSVPLTTDPQSDAAAAATLSLRNDLVPASFAGLNVDVLVGGASGFNVDFFDDVSTRTPIVFVFVLGLSFILLTVVFRSIVLPIKAIFLNLLSVAAAYGLVALFFQEGVGPSWVKDIFGFQAVESIEAWLPLFLFAVLFGLSMDYHVFLLSRIREHFDLTGDNTLSVAHGLRTTGAIITGAALIMVAVFGGFAAGELIPLQQMGFGLAVAVFLDATIVRSILVPASMKLLGGYNWYLPKWLEWLPHIDIEGHEAALAGREHEAEKVGAGTPG
jgi:RND superfamily putative drug exporter